MAGRETRASVETVFRIERANVLAALGRLVRDIDRAEERVQDAVLAALEVFVLLDNLARCRASAS
ncbi:MAG: hypothetical protein INR68_17175 [Methylobacterium mesophilicum]|nr:hypothetical protein [Methylobacterium mesophilicum]